MNRNEYDKSNMTNACFAWLLRYTVILLGSPALAVYMCINCSSREAYSRKSLRPWALVNHSSDSKHCLHLSLHNNYLSIT